MEISIKGILLVLSLTKHTVLKKGKYMYVCYCVLCMCVCMHVCVCLCVIPNHADYDIVIFIAGVRVSDAIFHGLVKYEENVNVMALTATATRTTHNDVIKSLDMQSPVIVSISPMKDNVIYCVSPKASIPSSFGPLADRLAAQRTCCSTDIYGPNHHILSHL